MRIAVIDDERPSRSELLHLLGEALPEAQLDEADSGSRAVELAAQHSYDAFFVDINLGDMTGTTLSVMLKKLHPHAQVVFATAYDEYAVKAFDMDAADYIMKPFDPARVERAVRRLRQRLGDGPQRPQALPEATPGVGRLSISCDKRVVVVEIDRIAYIETDSRCCILHTGQGDYTSNQPLGYFEKKLAGHRFFRTHKSYLVNLQHVIEIYPGMGGLYSLRLRGYEELHLPVGRKQVRLLKEIFDL